MRVPLVFSLHQVPVLLVGGAGRVGQRRLKTLSRAGAIVTIVDPATASPSTTCHVITAEFEIAHLLGQRIALACATAAVNCRVVAAARELGIWVYSASDPATADFVFPAVWENETIQLAVNTKSGAPQAAQAARDFFANQWNEDIATTVSQLIQNRPKPRE
jgi:siroheme synthase-like protein